MQFIILAFYRPNVMNYYKTNPLSVHNIVLNNKDEMNKDETQMYLMTVLVSHHTGQQIAQVDPQ